MDTIVLDTIPLTLDFDTLAKGLRVKPASSYFQDFRQLFETALAIGKPKACYRMVYVDAREDDAVILDSVRFKSRILRMNLDSANHAFAYVATCGQEMEAWSSSFDSMLHRFWADAISEAALRVASQALEKHLDQRYQPGQTSHMNPGSLPDWPLTEQIPLFGLIGDVRAATGVYLTESLLMVPRKSVSGINFPTESSFASCQLCQREHCPGRRAAYDPALVDHYGPAAAVHLVSG